MLRVNECTRLKSHVAFSFSAQIIMLVNLNWNFLIFWLKHDHIFIPLSPPFSNLIQTLIQNPQIFKLVFSARFSFKKRGESITRIGLERRNVDTPKAKNTSNAHTGQLVT